jgi:hypothetical protein
MKIALMPSSRKMSRIVFKYLNYANKMRNSLQQSALELNKAFK